MSALVKNILLCLLAFIIGNAVGMFANFGFLGLGSSLFPAPYELSSPESFAKFYAEDAVFGNFLFAWLAHWGQAFFGAIVAALIAPIKKLWIAMAVAAMALVGGIMVAQMIPAPTWFTALDWLGYLPFGFLGAKIVGEKGVQAFQ